MKRFLTLSLVLFCFATVAWAQEGTVTYEEVIKMNIELPPEVAHMDIDIPDTRTSNMQLFFNDSGALFRAAASEETHDTNLHDQGGTFRFQMRREENESFFDFENDKRTEKTGFMGRTFLIEGEQNTLSWRLTDERSEFLGYMCQKATAVRDSTTIEAWFTPEINIPAGPGFAGLPGLILVMNIDDGQRTYVAKEIDFSPIEKGVIKAPKKGKRVTREEFDEIVAAKMEEMDATSSGRGNVIIRMSN